MDKTSSKAGSASQHDYRPGAPGTGQRTVAALRKARALKAVSAAEAGQARPLSPAQQWLLVLLTAIASLLGALLFLGCVGFLLGSILLGSVLDEISSRDFSGPIERIDHYEVFFSSVANAGYLVRKDNPKILEGVTTYLWTVQPKGNDELRVFEWQHDLNSPDQQQALTPKTSAAIYADIELGYLKPQDATQFSFYDPDDKLCLAIVNTDFSLFQTPEGASGWLAQSQVPSGPVLAPLLSPEDAKKRASVAPPEEELTAEELAAQEGQSSEAVEVNTGEGQAPGDGSEPPVEVVGGGEETPPSDGGGGDSGAGDGGGGDAGGSGEAGGGIDNQ